MKKMLSLVLALALALGLSMAWAEETRVDWADVAPDIEAWGLAGDFYTLTDVDAAFWVPAFLPPSETEAAYEETGLLAAFQTEGTGRGFLISFYELDVEDIGAFAALMNQLGAHDGQTLSINGFSAYSFVLDDILHVSFLAEGGCILSFDFYPASDYVMNAVAQIIAASVQPYSSGE